ncbi:MAG: lysylphosphatidylglycerol synthase transmembrane domain-containing protein [Spirochaetota bacterium]
MCSNENKKKEKTPSYILRNVIISIIIGFATVSVIYVFMSDKYLIEKVIIMPYWLPLIGAALFFVVYIVDALRTKIILKALKEKPIKISSLINNAIQGFFFNYITPFSMGGQPYRIYDLSKNGISFIHASNAVVSRFLSQTFVTTVISIISYITFSRIFLSLGISGSIFLIGFTIGMITSISILIFTISKKIKKLFFKILHLKFIKKIVGLTHYTSDEIELIIDKKVYEFRDSLELLWKGNFFIMLIEATLGIFIFFIHSFILFLFIKFLTAEGLAYPGILEILMIHYVMGFVVYYAPTPGSSGAIEYAYYQVLSHPAFSEDRSAVLIGITAWRISTYYIPLIIGLITVFLDKKLILKKGNKTNKDDNVIKKDDDNKNKTNENNFIRQNN